MAAVDPPAGAAAQHPAHRLYAEHHGWVHNWLRRRLGCSHQAADLAQDTFVRALVATGVDDLKEPRAWLSTVAHGLMVNHLRRQRLERAYLDALAARPLPRMPSAEERAVTLETLMQIETLLSGLPPRVRSAFLLSQLDGCSYAEIAGQLGVSVSMVKKYMMTAMAHCLSITT